MQIKFTKMHGCGNDYIYVDCREGEPDDPGALSAEMSPRHSSVGADGLVLICRSEVADAKMRMFNLDGSEGMMCGNAIRCVGKYLYDNGIVDRENITVETRSGIKVLTLTVRDGAVCCVTVGMGKASFRADDIPVITDGEEFVGGEMTVAGREWRVTCVSMGNPHAVTFVDEVASLELERIGPLFEHHEMFPERINTEFVRVIDRQNLEMRVWERGSGETFACGTGACAAVAAAIREGICDAGVPVTVHLLGGELTITVSESWNVTMTGGAVKVYDGVYETREGKA